MCKRRQHRGIQESQHLDIYHFKKKGQEERQMSHPRFVHVMAGETKDEAAEGVAKTLWQQPWKPWK